MHRATACEVTKASAPTLPSRALYAPPLLLYTAAVWPLTGLLPLAHRALPTR